MIRTNFLFVLAIIVLEINLCLAPSPSDHLIPPPIPKQTIKIQKSLQPKQFSPLPPEVGNQIVGHQQIRNPPTEPSSFMHRIAKWFGYGGNTNEITQEQQQQQVHSQQLQQQQQITPEASYYQPQYKVPPPHAFQYHRSKAPCNPCNKVPWLPMFQYPLLHGGHHLHHNNQQIFLPQPNQQQLQPNQFHYHQRQLPPQQQFPLPPPPSPQQQQQQLIHSASVSVPEYQQQQQQLPLFTQPMPSQYAPNFLNQNPHSQRAVKFNYPSPNNPIFSYLTQQQLTPIPVPNLSATPIPPLYNAVPFHSQFNGPKYSTQQNNQQNFHNNNNFEHLSEPSEIQNVLPTQIPANDIHVEQQSNGFEVIQSIPVTDFLASIEYPAKVIQSDLIDLDKNSNQHNFDENSNNDQNLDQNSQPNGNNYPKLIELGSYESTSPHTQNEPKPQIQSDFLAQPIIVHNHKVIPIDNFVEASSHNISIRHENHLDISNYHDDSSNLQIISSTNRPQDIFVTTQSGISSTFRPDYSTEQTQYTTVVDIQPSLQTAAAGSEFFKRERVTPKHILNAPIVYNHNNIDNSYSPLYASSPRPFTRDPSELNIRSSTFTIPTSWQTVSSSSSLSSTSSLLPSSTSIPLSHSPTPTSTYSAIDASGQWAGISPPSQFQISNFNQQTINPEKRPKQIHQIIIPYTTKNHPQPFKAREQQQQPQQPQQQQQPEKHYKNHQTTDNRYSGWSNSNEHQEFHEEQESKLITNTQSTATGATRKTTKYLTKILASNIRELLRREHELKNKSKTFGVDLSTLQKNIDDWTEQEFTSLSHKPSTVSIRGRSKHIPHEYLTTTQSMRQSKTTKLFATTAKSPTIRNIPSLLLNNDIYSQSIEDNNIAQSERINKIQSSTTKKAKTTNNPTTTTTKFTTMHTTTSTSTTTTPKSITQPFYIRNIILPNENEVWQKVRVSISPLTKEKVYVVTPQPRFSTTKSTNNGADGIGTFKSPRFLIRPTPASSSSSSSSNSGNSSNHIPNYITSTEISKTSPYSPELFGLMGISAYIPSDPVDVFDGHSRVITVVTPTPHSNKRSTENAERRLKISPILNDNKS